MSSVQSFDFSLAVPGCNPCSLCEVYSSDVEVTSPCNRFWFGLCRICLRRMRATLKEAEKALPATPKIRGFKRPDADTARDEVGK